MLTDLGRERAMQFFGLSRYVGPAPVPLGAVQRLRARVHGGKPYLNRERLSTGLRQPHRQQGDVRSARPGRELRQVAVPVRRAGQRQDRAWPKASAAPRRRDAHAATRSTSTARSSRCTTPSATPHRRSEPTSQQRRHGHRARSPLGPHPPAGRRWSAAS